MTMTTDARTEEGGFVLVTTSLFLIVLMAMAAFAIDLGAWYSRAGQLQRAADSAALAGVVYMPNNLARARAVALETAERNGFADSDPGLNPAKEIDVVVEEVPDVAQRLRVTIHDRVVEAYFARVFLDSISIGRSAVGHYAEPIPLGSPENHFGIGSGRRPDGTMLTSGTYGGGTPPPTQTQNFHAAVNGRCAAAEDGDLVLSQFDGNANTNAVDPYRCASTEQNPSYDSDGYVYNVEFDRAPGSGFNIQIWDPAFTPWDNTGANNNSFDYSLDDKWDATQQRWMIETTDLDTTYAVSKPDTDGTPLDYGDDDVLATRTFTSKQAGVAGQWVTIATIPAGGDGVAYPAKYRLTVRTDDFRVNSWGVNVFAIRAVPSSGANASARCTTLGTSTECPKVFGENYMSIWANASNSLAELWLAQIADVHAGKRLRIDLWDPGEGSRTLEIRRPTANGQWTNTPFVWASADGTYGSTVPTTSLDLGLNCTNPSGANYTAYPQPGPSRSSVCKFNDRRIVIYIDIPTSYDDQYNRGWWRIRYRSQGTVVTDRTTWQINVEGDPVHLVEE